MSTGTALYRNAALFILLASCLACTTARGAVDCPVTARQNWPWDGRIFIDATMPAGTNDVEISVSFDKAGSRHEIVLDLGNGLISSPYCLTGGVHRLVWDPVAAGYEGPISELNITAKSYTAAERAWLVINVETGESEYVALGSEPTDANGKPWQDTEYKKTKMVFRRIPAGTFTRGYTAAEKTYIQGLDAELGLASSKMLTAAETTLTSDFYISIFPALQAQVARIVNAPTTHAYYNSTSADCGQLVAAGRVCFQRGSNSVEGVNWPLTKFAVTPNSVVGMFRQRCGNRFWIDLPTCAQWQRAARPDSQWLWYDTSSYSGGMTGGTTADTLYTVTNIINKISQGYKRKYVDNNATYSVAAVPGAYLSNSYGLYDLVGNRPELLLDQWNSNEDAPSSAGVDPVGLTNASANRMECNSFNNLGRISNWSICYAATFASDGTHDTSQERCYRYVIHLNPPQSFGGKWVNEE